MSTNDGAPPTSRSKGNDAWKAQTAAFLSQDKAATEPATATSTTESPTTSEPSAAVPNGAKPGDVIVIGEHCLNPRCLSRRDVKLDSEGKIIPNPAPCGQPEKPGGKSPPGICRSTRFQPIHARIPGGAADREVCIYCGTSRKAQAGSLRSPGVVTAPLCKVCATDKFTRS